jgi:hypothetical protein
MSVHHSLSLFVPYMFPNITVARITKIFILLHLGEVDHVDFIPKTDKNGKSYNAAYIHFYRWFECSAAVNFQERVLNPDKEARIVYDEPWYWIVLENTAVKSIPEEKPTTDLVSADYVAALETGLASTRKELEDFQEDMWQRVAELEERVLDLENDGQEQVMRVLARREQTQWGCLGSHQVEQHAEKVDDMLLDAEDYSDMPELVDDDAADRPGYWADCA